MSAVWCAIQTPRRAVPGAAPPERCVAAPRGGVPDARGRPPSVAPAGLRGSAGARTGALALGAAAAAATACRAARRARKRRCRRRRLALVEDLTQAVDEALNTLEDASLHINRITPWLSGPSADTAAPVQGKRRVVILGTGWAAHAIAKVVDTSANDVCVVSPRNYFVFTPMLAAASVGTVEYRSILEHIRSSNPTLRFYQGVCEAIDVDRHEITVGPAPELERTLGLEHASGRPDGERFVMPYDVLVTAVGVRPSSLDVPGVSDHCLFLKDIPDANNIRKRVTECFERADLPTAGEEDKRRLLTFVVVGGGPTGCEFSGELSDFVRNDLQRFYPKLAPLVRILLVHRGKAVLPAFGEQLQALATTTLQEQGIEVLTSAKVTCVTADSITLATEGRSETISCGLAVWAAGQVGQDIVAALRRQVPAQGACSKDASKLIVDNWLRVVGVPDGSIIALGDCARIDGLEPALPQTAQVAAQQGAFVARLLNRCYELSLDAPPRLPPEAELSLLARARGQAEAPRFRFFNLGQLAYLGQNQAVAEVDLGSTKVSQASGRAAFLLWRSVYVVKQVSFRNRVLVLFDWFKSRIFGRDFTRF